MGLRKGILLIGFVFSILAMAGLVILLELVVGYRAVVLSRPTPTPTKTPRPTLMATSTPTPVVLAMAVETSVTFPTLASSPPGLAVSPAASTSTLTPVTPFTSVPMVTFTPGETASPTDAAAAGPALTSNDAFIPANIPTVPATTAPNAETSGWSFVGLRVCTDQYEGGLWLYGDLINNTGVYQELFFITGTFYNAQGQAIADEGNAYGYSPALVIPPGERVPFELTVEGVQSAANFDLRVEAQPSSQVPRQDFEFSDLDQLDEGYGYCIGGTLRNPGSELQDYLVVVAVLYDGQDRVIGFGEHRADPKSVVGDETEEFEICVDPHDQDVARYELRAWGQ